MDSMGAKGLAAHSLGSVAAKAAAKAAAKVLEVVLPVVCAVSFQLVVL
jgi:hypothetical protein